MNRPYFVYKLIAPRPAFPADISEDEAEIVRRHGEYRACLLSRGNAVIFGQVLNPAGCWGLAVIEAGSIEQVHALAADDPAVSTGPMTFEVLPMPPASARRHQNGDS